MGSFKSIALRCAALAANARARAERSDLETFFDKRKPHFKGS